MYLFDGTVGNTSKSNVAPDVINCTDSMVIVDSTTSESTKSPKKVVAEIVVAENDEDTAPFSGESLNISLFTLVLLYLDFPITQLF